ncbi:MAG: HipA domain-containing protein, partial [Bacteroidales bacterium]|nr:HipA domain-containing protein [Bacteroidales bacterium]
ILLNNRKHISISGVQEKFSLIQVKNKLRFANETEQGTHILKPIPSFGKNNDQMPANEHLSMQIANQVYGIEAAENALIFFKDSQPAYITKRFDLKADGSKFAQEDFASLNGRTPQTHGENFKYLGNYLEIFETMKKFLPLYKIEALKLFKLLVFNYLFCNGDTHFKNFSIIETSFGDFKLSPAYDLLNTRLHIDDKDFALDDGLLPRNLAQAKIAKQFEILAKEAEIDKIFYEEIMNFMLSKSKLVEKFISVSFLSEKAKRFYLQSYQTRLKQLNK